VSAGVAQASVDRLAPDSYYHITLPVV